MSFQGQEEILQSLQPLASTFYHLPHLPALVPHPSPTATSIFPGKTLLDLDSRAQKEVSSPAIQNPWGVWSFQKLDGLGEAARENEESNNPGPENWFPERSLQHCATSGKSLNLSISSSDNWQAYIEGC